MTKRENLIEELKSKLDSLSFVEYRFEVVADFIIQDRKRIVDPLVKLNKNYLIQIHNQIAIEDTLKRAGEL